MKFNFKKVTAIATSVLMTGMTIGTAVAAGVAPSDLGGSNFAIVYGANASSKDVTASTNIDTALKSQMDSSTSVSAGANALSEDEVALNDYINTSSSKILGNIQDNKLSGLADEVFSWDDGDGEDDYDIHEEIVINDVKVATSLVDEDFDEVALTTVKDGLSYRLVLDDYVNFSKIGDADADDFYLTVLGQEYEITGATNTSITVTTSSEVSMGVDQTYTLSNGKTVTLGAAFFGSVEVLVDGTSKIISEDSSAKVNGVKVRVESIGYNSNAPETSKAVLKIGEDLSKTYDTGDEFIGEDEDEPTWVWDISNFANESGYRYIGVTFNQRADRAKDDLTQYVGGGYVFPNNFAAVTLDSITDSDYQDLNIYFEEEDLYSTVDDSEATASDAKVLVIEGKNDDTISVNGFETSKMYLYVNTTKGTVETYALDVNGEYSPTKKMRLQQSQAYTNTTTADLATIEIGDTNLVAQLAINGNNASGYLKIVNDLGTDYTVLTANISALNSLDKFGALEEDAENGDVIFSTTDVSTKDTEFMDAYGVKIAEGTNVEAQVDNDEVTLSVPEEQVYAQVSVSTGASASGSSAGNILYTDDEAGYSGKALVIVGGSCINSAAAEALGVSEGTCGADFTAATGVSAGQFLIEKTTLGGKTAIVVAGYEADDTFQAAQYLINNGAIEGVYTTATQEKVVTA